jgi:hypothetical protein
MNRGRTFTRSLASFDLIYGVQKDNAANRRENHQPMRRRGGGLLDIARRADTLVIG